MPRDSKRKSANKINATKKARFTRTVVQTPLPEASTVSFICHLQLALIINWFACSSCKEARGFQLSISKIHLLNFYINVSCNNCEWTKGTWLLPPIFNLVFQSGKTVVGIADTQINRLFAFIGMSCTTEAGEQRMPDFQNGSSTAAVLQDGVDQNLIDLAAESMDRARNSLISETKKAKGTTLSVALDGCYNDTGHKRNSAQGCLVSCIAKVRGAYKVIGNACVKKPQEVSDETLKSRGKGRIAPRGTVSSNLEKIGTRDVFESTILPIHQEFPDYTIRIACDKDAGIRNSKNTNIYIDDDKKNQLMIPEDRLHYVDDRAHISKNIFGTIKRNFKTGSSETKFTPQMMLEFYIRIRLATEVIMDKCAAGEWTFEDAKAKMKKTALHAYGNHSMCDGNCPEKAPILQPHGKLTQETIEAYIDKFMATYFGDEFIKSLIDTGSSSPVEYFHALMIRRRLWVKGTHASVLSLRYEAAAAIATLIYNEGQDKAFRLILNRLNFAVPEAGLQRIERLEKERKNQCGEKMKKKTKVQEKRRRNQKQFTIGGYANQVQRDIENSRKAEVEIKEQEEDLDTELTFEEAEAKVLEEKNEADACSVEC